MTQGLLTSRITKNKLSTLASKIPTALNKQNFVNYRNTYNNLIRAAKKLHFSRALLANTKNLRKTWGILNEALNKSKIHSPIHSLFSNNKLLSNPLDIANTFNSYFTTIAENNAIHPVTDPEPQLPPPSPFTFDINSTPVTDAEILECVKSLENKKTPDMTGLSSCLLKKVIPEILPPLKHIFNQSLATGTLPTKFKIRKSNSCL